MVVSLFNLPDGSGFPFTQAQLPDGSFVDATLRVQLLDYNGTVIAYFPAEDMWLESLDAGMIPCVGGTIANSNTDADGWTVWASPLGAGGASSADCRLLVSGDSFIEGWNNLAYALLGTACHRQARQAAACAASLAPVDPNYQDTITEINALASGNDGQDCRPVDCEAAINNLQ